MYAYSKGMDLGTGINAPIGDSPLNEWEATNRPSGCPRRGGASLRKSSGGPDGLASFKDACASKVARAPACRCTLAPRTLAGRELLSTLATTGQHAATTPTRCGTGGAPRPRHTVSSSGTESGGARRAPPHPTPLPRCRRQHSRRRRRHAPPAGAYATTPRDGGAPSQLPACRCRCRHHPADRRPQRQGTHASRERATDGQAATAPPPTGCAASPFHAATPPPRPPTHRPIDEGVNRPTRGSAVCLHPSVTHTPHPPPPPW